MCCFIVQVLILVTTVAIGGCESQAIDGFGYELLVVRFDYLENSMKELQAIARELQDSYKETKKFEKTVQSELQEAKAMKELQELVRQEFQKSQNDIKKLEETVQDIRSLTDNGLKESQEEARREFQKSQKEITNLEKVVRQVLQEVDGIQQSQDMARQEFQESKNDTKKLGKMVLSEVQIFKGLTIKGFNESQEAARQGFQDSQDKIKKLEETTLHEQQELKAIGSALSSCRNAPNKSGRYTLQFKLNTTVEVFCEQNLYGGGWIVIQNRFDGSEDFNREWNEYRDGFGSLDGEFWIGLEKIHLITILGNYDLMIHLENFDGVVKYAYYKQFVVYSEKLHYYMGSAKFYSGTAGDSLVDHRYRYFSTIDRDNDADSSGHVALSYHSGWWFNDYFYFNSNLNGRYSNEKGFTKMHWRTFKNDRQGLKVSKMMIRESLN